MRNISNDRQPFGPLLKVVIKFNGVYALAVGLDNRLVYVSSMDVFCKGLVSQPHLVTVSYLIEIFFFFEDKLTSVGSFILNGRARS